MKKNIRYPHMVSTRTATYVLRWRLPSAYLLQTDTSSTYCPLTFYLFIHIAGQSSPNGDNNGAGQCGRGSRYTASLITAEGGPSAAAVGRQQGNSSRSPPYCDGCEAPPVGYPRSLTERQAQNFRKGPQRETSSLFKSSPLM